MPTHPLELPEILVRVGHFLPLWPQGLLLVPEYPTMRFSLRTVLSCILVSKLWHQTLVPVLWTICTYQVMKRVPEDVALRHRHFIRLLEWRTELPLPFHICTNLVELILSSNTLQLDAQRALVRSNPGLKILRWNGPRVKVIIEPQDYANLKRIRALSISQWIGSGDILIRVLKAVAGSLVNLELEWIGGISSAELVAETSSGRDVKYTDGLVLPCLESFTSSHRILRVFDPTDLVQCCPNLKSCGLTLTDEIDIKRLSDALLGCPKLETLAVRDYTQSQLVEVLFRNLSRDGQQPQGSKKHNLVSITVSQIAVSKDLVSTILLYAPTLKHLRIMVQSWGCRGIEQLSLDFAPTRHECDHEDSVSAEEAFKDGPVLGWNLFPKPTARAGSFMRKLMKGFYKDVFEAVQGLEQLRVVRLNGLKFVRVGHNSSAL
ncbi:hypothetical protein BGW39_010960 [Mortierella sp. 14UC]|nr:hypothetical protein BGW39_010960 [Mortierella sp. 14UC]